MNSYFITDVDRLNSIGGWLINNLVDFGLIVLAIFNLMAGIFLYLRVRDIQRSLNMGKDSLLAMLITGNLIVGISALVLLILLSVIG